MTYNENRVISRIPLRKNGTPDKRFKAWSQLNDKDRKLVIDFINTNSVKEIVKENPQKKVRVSKTRKPPVKFLDKAFGWFSKFYLILCLVWIAKELL